MVNGRNRKTYIYESTAVVALNRCFVDWVLIRANINTTNGHFKYFFN